MSFDEALEMSLFQTVVSERKRLWAVGGRVEGTDSAYEKGIDHLRMCTTEA